MIFILFGGCQSASETLKNTDDTALTVFSSGCGLAPSDPLGGTQISIEVEGADLPRGFYLSLPDDYDSSKAHRLIFGFPGTDWVGSQVQPYLGLEVAETLAASNEIFVYPDPLWREFEGWGTFGGWLLGPHAYPADGTDDLNFVSAILDYMAEGYCIDTEKVFATGHSWGGDMAQVVSCFMGDRFTATVPVAANYPYWFESSDNERVNCVGTVAVWTMFGENDTHFTNQDYPGAYGDACRDFWLEENECDGVDNHTVLEWGEAECVGYLGCKDEVQYCLYDAQWGHQIPESYFAQATMDYFRQF
jgi:polyhydroxybutyrate depolymerase